MLLLEQTNYPSWMPAELALQDYDASFAFPSADHPIMQGVGATDLRWWAGDHRVVAKTMHLPSRYNVRALASVGSHSGLNLAAAAAEVPLGAGGRLCSQWLLTQRFDQEPMAGVLLQRLLNYCAPTYPRAVLKPIALVAETNAAATAKLAELGVLAENVSGRLPGLSPTFYPVLMIAGGSNAWQEATARLADLATYVSAGGKLVLHKPTAAFLSAAQPTLFPELNYTDAQLGSVLRREVTNPVVRLANDDLYWIDHAGDWQHSETLSTNVSGGSFWLYSNGRIETSVRVMSAGNYTFEVIAAGTTAAGVFPQVAITVNGVYRTNWFLTNTAMTRYTFTLYLGVGTNNLGLVFLNDANPAGEDRNAAFDRVTLTPDTASRIVNWSFNLVWKTAVVQWEGLPFKPYEVRVCTNLAGALWQVATNFIVPGNVGSWTDTGFGGVPPLSPAAPQRFYRVRQSGP